MSQMFIEVSRFSTPKAIEEQIKRLITVRGLVAGDRLPPERELATRFGVSRSTLREALRALTEAGVVSPRHGAGWVIEPNQMTVASNLAMYFRLEDVSFDQITECRLATEPTIARLAAERHSDEELVAIERTLEGMSDGSPPEAFLEADSVFHALIAASAHNVLLSFSTHPTLSLLEEVRLSVLEQTGAIEASQREHAQIVEAFRERNGEGAERAMREHLERFTERGRPVAAAVRRQREEK